MDKKMFVDDVVEVRSKEAVLLTLDSGGCLDGLPFMPEMFAFCGRRFRVYKRAHKTCDTVNDYRGRRMHDAVHLEGVRCNGGFHGGCDAECLIFWKTAWLRRIDGDSVSPEPCTGRAAVRTSAIHDPAGCGEQDVLAGAIRSGANASAEPHYVCQATQLPAATEPLPWWDPRQYVEDLESGNVGPGRMAKGFLYMGYRQLINAGIGLGAPLRWFYDRAQGMRGGVPYPRRSGKIPPGETTPSSSLDLQPGEWVRVKSYDAILATCDEQLRNRGMRFDAEMVPYCGKTYRVLKRVNNIIDEKTGKIQQMKTAAIILEKVVCQARYSECRLFCPRSIYPFWRETWLERVDFADLPAGESTTAGEP
jgi:hypothetical protein